MKTQHFFCYLAVLTICFTACKPDKEDPKIEEPEKNIPVTDITLNYEKLTLIPGDTITLIATVQPDSATNKTVTWESSNPAVAIVNNDGLVTAIADGEAIITATTQDGSKKATCSVAVDYRAKWVGSYDCKVDGGYPDRPRVMVDVIAREDSLLYIMERDLPQHYFGARHTVKVDRNGSFSSDYKAEAFFLGNFIQDSIYINYLIVSPGGAYMDFYYKGKKNKSK
ncbi:MAG: Ig-like domain-containing protein [Bacteroidales bacterium]|jgi:transglutaminase/protease-like cytokinesis protein 3|nr:Ig-like domain-containing protein [Bacteroidales bacterium]